MSRHSVFSWAAAFCQPKALIVIIPWTWRLILAELAAYA